MDTFRDTHPWITFSLDLGRVPATTWLLLGECAAEILRIAVTPLMPAAAERLNRTFVSRGIHGTAAIEGNTLDLEEVELRLSKQLDLPPSQEYLGREIDNLERAYRLVADTVAESTSGQLTEERIRAYNRTILNGLELDPEARAGVYATRQHGVMRYRAPAPDCIRRLMPRFVAWMNDERTWAAGTAHAALALGIVRAVTAHLYIAWIHPFGDGNGRTARIVEAEILGMHGVPSITYHLLSDHYNRTRQMYYRRLAETSARREGDPYAFLAYAVEGLADGLRVQAGQIREQWRAVAWRDYVHEVFRGRSTARYTRLRRIARELPGAPEGVSRSELRRLSPAVERLYGGKGPKTVSRDINELVNRGLAVRTRSGVRARVEILEGFTPARRQAGGDLWKG